MQEFNTIGLDIHFLIGVLIIIVALLVYDYSQS